MRIVCSIFCTSWHQNVLRKWHFKSRATQLLRLTTKTRQIWTLLTPCVGRRVGMDSKPKEPVMRKVLSGHDARMHYIDVIMSAMAIQITSLTIVYSTVYSGADQRNHQSSASLAFVRGIHWWPVNSPHKRPATRKMFPFDDVIMWIVISCP